MEVESEKRRGRVGAGPAPVPLFLLVSLLWMFFDCFAVIPSP